jgi:2-polyprenyl-3-methyl-5-hydroxy-6-metoxy-1,4-benzoquinol methylase
MLDELVAPIEAGEADAVMGSRMMDSGGARRGGMPMYKYVGNRILTTAQNALVGSDLSEWHSGYRAYRTSSLDGIDFEADSDGFDFDTEILIQLHHAGARIAEVAIPTYYGDEISHVNGMRYAADVIGHVGRYRLASMGFGVETVPGTEPDEYEAKHEEGTSHVQLLRWLSTRAPGRVLDVGCADGAVSGELRRLGHHVTGVDVHEAPGVRDHLDEFVAADLDRGLPDGLDGPYDVIVAADVLEHLRRPDLMLEALRGRLAPGGVMAVSVPNFGHWYPRLRTVTGRFDYDRRGILDRDHLRFFTRASFERLLAHSGWAVRRRSAVGLPLEVADRGTGDAGDATGEPGGLGGLVRRLDRAAVALRPTLFGYQLLYELSPAPATNRSHSPEPETVLSVVVPADAPSSGRTAGPPPPNQAQSSRSS